MRILLVDDLRNFRPEISKTHSVMIARTSKDALSILSEDPDGFDAIFLDHDLGGEDTTRPIAFYLEEKAFLEDWYPVGRIFIHTSNSVGRKWIYDSLNRGYSVNLVDASVYFYN